MSELTDRARSWAQNEEMVDLYFTTAGKLLNELADALDEAEQKLSAASTWRRELQQSSDSKWDASEELRRERDQLREVLESIKWTSCEKDNMEFAAKITCYQMDSIRELLKDE